MDKPMRDLDWNLLRVLDALLQTHSPTRAAHRLGVSQSAVSHALARLREHFADELLVRTAGAMVPTARATELREPLREALQQIERALQPPVFDPATARRTFRIGTSDYAQFVLLGPLVERVRRLAPTVDLWVLPITTHDTDAPLVDGSLDLIVSVPPASRATGHLCDKVLFTERFACLLRAGHPEVHGVLSLGQYAQLPHAFVAPRGTPGGVVDELLAHHGLQRRVVLMVPHFLVVPHVIASSDLVVTLASRLARAFAATLPLQVLEPPLRLPTFSIAMTWHERQHRDPGHVWLRALLSEVAAGLGPG